MNTWLQHAALIALAAPLVAACGGGSNSTSTSTTTLNVPGAPTALVATAGNASASIAFTAPASDGGAAISGYSASCTGAGATKTGEASASPISIALLTNASTYSCSVTASNAQGTSVASGSVSVTPAAGLPAGSSFSLSSAAATGGSLPAEYTCDGPGSTPALAWSGAPSGTTEFAVLMSTLPGDGSTKYNWVLHGIPPTRTSLAKDSYGVGTLGVGSDGPLVAYQAPCSQGLGEKAYTFTVYALSASPAVPANAAVSGAALAAALPSITLGTAALSLTAAPPRVA
jgi:phosphatidylethanolamine-binding protein (PEBP) family uncharacterized protein